MLGMVAPRSDSGKREPTPTNRFQVFLVEKVLRLETAGTASY